MTADSHTPFPSLSPSPSPAPGAAHKRLEVFVGKWINEGQTVASPDAPALPIRTSDIYEWMPGGFFILHTAYGRIGDHDVGGTEIIGYDEATQTYRWYFFDGQGGISTDELTVTAQGDTWTWKGATTSCTAVFSDNGKTQTAHHVRLDADGRWVPSMEVTLTKVE